MKNAMENNTGGIPSKDQVIETVIDTFVRVIGFIERKDVFPTTDVGKDFYIDGDDLSFFAEAVKKYFGIKPTHEEWLNIDWTIENIADLVLHHLSKK